jgi:putative Holliday junction resolvase
VSRILAIDYGARRVGLALSDPTRTLATGLPTLERKGGDAWLAREVERLAGENQVTEVLVGDPLNMDGTRGPRAREAERFAELLRQRLPIPIRLWDERLTTVRAQRVLRESGVKARAGRSRLDRLAAVLLLQNYLDAGRTTPAGRGRRGDEEASGDRDERDDGMGDREAGA